MIVEGINCASELLKAGYPMEKVIINKDLNDKFGDIVKSAIGRDPVMPDRLEKVLSLPSNDIPMENSYEKFKSWLLENL